MSAKPPAANVHRSARIPAPHNRDYTHGQVSIELPGSPARSEAAGNHPGLAAHQSGHRFWSDRPRKQRAVFTGEDQFSSLFLSTSAPINRGPALIGGPPPGQRVADKHNHNTERSPPSPKSKAGFSLARSETGAAPGTRLCSSKKAFAKRQHRLADLTRTFPESSQPCLATQLPELAPLLAGLCSVAG